MRLETAFNLCTISSRAISSFLSQNLILRQNTTILCSCFPLHQKVLHGWGSASGEGAQLRGWGARQRLPSRDWSPAPLRGAPCARVGAAQRKRKPARPASSRGHRGSLCAPLRSPGSPTCALRSHLEALHMHPKVIWNPRICTSKVTREPFVRTHFGLLELKCVHSPIDRLTRACTPRGPRTAALPAQRLSLAHPSQGSLSPPVEKGGAVGVASWAAPKLPAPLYLRLSLGRCRGRSSSRERPARAASCRPTSVGPRVRGGSSGGQASPPGAACLQRTQAAREARAAVSGPRTSPWLAPSHCVHSTPQRPDDASHACARLWLPHPTDVHEQGCAHSALDGVSPSPGISPSFRGWHYREHVLPYRTISGKVPIIMNGLGNSSRGWLRFKVLLMSIRCVCRRPSVVTVRH